MVHGTTVPRTVLVTREEKRVGNNFAWRMVWAKVERMDILRFSEKESRKGSCWRLICWRHFWKRIQARFYSVYVLTVVALPLASTTVLPRELRRSRVEVRIF